MYYLFVATSILSFYSTKSIHILNEADLNMKCDKVFSVIEKDISGNIIVFMQVTIYTTISPIR